LGIPEKELGKYHKKQLICYTVHTLKVSLLNLTKEVQKR